MTRATILRDVKGWVRDDAVLRDLLALVDRDADPELLRAWTDDEALLAERWAVAVHAKASDNPVRVPPEPDHVRRLPRMLQDGLWPASRYDRA